MQDYYEMYMAPYYAELDRWAIEQQNRNQRDANSMAGMQTAVSAIGSVALIALATSAVCMEMYRQGYFPAEYMMVDHQFGYMVRMRRPDVYEGYVRFCNWIIPKMRKSKLFVRFVNLFFQPWVKDMAYLMRARKKKCRFGRLINIIGFKLMSKMGRK
jgi:hypothetical protein